MMKFDNQYIQPSPYDTPFDKAEERMNISAYSWAVMLSAKYNMEKIQLADDGFKVLDWQNDEEQAAELKLAMKDKRKSVEEMKILANVNELVFGISS
jgi:single-stranded DNA-specific DHH superfamily exonuclease